MSDRDELVATILRVIQRTADKQGNVTMLRLAENIAKAAELFHDAQARAEGRIAVDEEPTPEMPCAGECLDCYGGEGVCDECPAGEDPACAHDWLDRPESDTRECLICGAEVSG